jgi:hypothetical protein
MLMSTDTIAVTQAEQVGAYILQLHFSDGTTQRVDFEPFLSASHHPLIRRYLAPTEFARFRVTDGDLVWNDYDLCFPIADLYENHL